MHKSTTTVLDIVRSMLQYILQGGCEEGVLAQHIERIFLNISLVHLPLKQVGGKMS